jgi:hypothetical protein
MKARSKEANARLAMARGNSGKEKKKPAREEDGGLFSECSLGGGIYCIYVVACLGGGETVNTA